MAKKKKSNKAIISTTKNSITLDIKSDPNMLNIFTLGSDLYPASEEELEIFARMLAKALKEGDQAIVCAVEVKHIKVPRCS